MDFRLSISDYLATLVGDVASSAARIETAPAEAVTDLAARAASDRARLSLRLDASPITDETAAAVDDGTFQRQPVAANSAGGGGWAAALKLEGMATQDVAAVEYANLLIAHDAEARLAQQLFEEPLTALEELHGLICDGLVDPALIGRPRRTSQAIHDGGQGLVIFNAPDPDLVPGLLDDLAAWLRGGPTSRGHSGSAWLPAVVVAAVVAERLLEWQPYEAANGRLARAVAAIVLRAFGVDRLALAVPERRFAQDPGGYHAEIAATQRRRGDLSLWVETYVEAVAAGLASAERALGVRQPAELPAGAQRALDQVDSGATITVAEYAERTRVSRITAVAHLRAAAGSGALSVEPRTRGLRFRRP